MFRFLPTMLGFSNTYYEKRMVARQTPRLASTIRRRRSTYRQPILHEVNLNQWLSVG